MGAYKKQFASPLTYNSPPVSASTYSSTTVSSQPSYGNDNVDRPGDIRVEPDDLTVGAVVTGASIGHKVYRFITLDSGSASVVSGDVVLLKDVAGSIGTTVVASGIAGRNGVAGVAIGALTAGNQGWVQIRGQHPTLNCTGATVAQGDVMIMSATAKQATNIAAGTAPTYLAIGAATAANATNAVSVRLCIPE